MSEYIEREAVLDAIKSAFFDQQCDCEVMPDVFRRVQGVEVANVAPVRHAAKAESAISKTGLMCTACYSDADADAVYCKYCGALMDGKEDDHD